MSIKDFPPHLYPPGQRQQGDSPPSLGTGRDELEHLLIQGMRIIADEQAVIRPLMHWVEELHPYQGESVDHYTSRTDSYREAILHLRRAAKDPTCLREYWSGEARPILNDFLQDLRAQAEQEETEFPFDRMSQVLDILERLQHVMARWPMKTPSLHRTRRPLPLPSQPSTAFIVQRLLQLLCTDETIEFLEQQVLGRPRREGERAPKYAESIAQNKRALAMLQAGSLDSQSFVERWHTDYHPAIHQLISELTEQVNSPGNQEAHLSLLSLLLPLRELEEILSEDLRSIEMILEDIRQDRRCVEALQWAVEAIPPIPHESKEDYSHRMGHHLRMLQLLTDPHDDPSLIMRYWNEGVQENMQLFLEDLARLALHDQNLQEPQLWEYLQRVSQDLQRIHKLLNAPQSFRVEVYLGDPAISAFPSTKDPRLLEPCQRFAERPSCHLQLHSTIERLPQKGSETHEDWVLRIQEHQQTLKTLISVAEDPSMMNQVEEMNLFLQSQKLIKDLLDSPLPHQVQAILDLIHATEPLCVLQGEGLTIPVVR